MNKFTELFPEDLTYDKESRIKKAKKIVAVLKDAIERTSDKKCLDFGCSLGYITGYLGRHFRNIIGIDVDDYAIKKAKKINKSPNVSFFISQENKVPFPDNFFDVVVFNQIYEHVQNPSAIVSEIKRVLKKDGVCYFGARNKFGIFDGHYNLPFLSWLPKDIANLYIKLTTGKREYDIKLYTLFRLNKLVRNFEKDDYTLRIIDNPKKYNAIDAIPNIIGINKIIHVFSKLFYFFIPNYIWILKKTKRKELYP